VELDVTATANASQSPPHGDELAPGLRLDHFRIEKKLGAGGMGEVYLATDLALDRPVAIKVLPSGVSSGTPKERLIREARAQARIHHANVAHIYFIGEDQGRVYFAMEYVEGETLADKLARGPMSVEDALAAIHAAALGLREAQRRGFTHRDVKPSNLMIDRDGALKVLDFGLVAGGGERAADAPVQQTTLAGTPLYMAPEQALGEPVDLRADIYALGATLYHLVAGKPPFVAESFEQLMTLHRSAQRPQVARKGIARTQSTAIDALVARMMAPEPAQRFASYDELLRAIELASAQHTRPAGIWVRGVALLVDLLLVTFAIALAKAPLWPDQPVPFALVGFPTMAVIAMIGIARWGTTPGMALFELEIASVATGARPTWRQAFVRTSALAAVPIGLAVASRVLALFGVAVAGDLLELTGLALVGILGLAVIHASLRVPGKRTPWDRLAGTIVRYRTGRRSAAS
jgi:hypothetical protein